MLDPIEEILRQAEDAGRDGRYQDQERLCLEALERNPRNVRAELILGAQLAAKGFVEASALHLERALSIDPYCVEAIRLLATVFLRSGRNADAITLCERMIFLDPSVAEAHNALGICLLKLGREEEAYASFEAALRLRPASAAILLRLALCRLRQGDDEASHRHISDALSMDRGSLESFVRTLMALREFDDALLACKALISFQRDNPSAHSMAATATWELGRYDESREQLEQALELNSEDARLYYLKGSHQQVEGDLVGADLSFKRSVELQPNQGAAYYSLAQTRIFEHQEDALLQAMLDVSNSDGLSRGEQYQLQLAIGKAYEDLEQFGSSMMHYDQGNRCLLDQLSSQRPFVPENYERAVDAAIRGTRVQFESPESCVCESDLPVIVMGMMRSGTTLTEQILTSHPDVGTAGEQLFWTHHTNESVDSDSGRRAANSYCSLLAAHGPDNRRVIDKLPGNFMFAGLIHSLLPNARLVHVRRDPLDTCLSIWTTRLGRPMDFAGLRRNIVFVFRQYWRLMEHWRALLPSNRFYEIRYEDLVQHREVTIKGLVSFLGLSWREECLHPERNRRRIHTASVYRARKGFDASRIGRAKRFEPWLEEFQQLNDLGYEHPSASDMQ